VTLSGLAALVENSRGTRPERFLNALEGIESRSTTALLGAAAMLEREATGRWTLFISSGDFTFLEKDTEGGFAVLQPLIELATARPNQFVLGSPVSEGGEAIFSPVLIALANVKRPTVLVGKLDYSTLRDALLEASMPPGLHLTLRGTFMDHPSVRSIVEARG